MTYINKDKLENATTPSQALNGLPSHVVEQLVDEWLEAHESGWRPRMYAAGRRLDLYNDLKHVQEVVRFLKSQR